MKIPPTRAERAVMLLLLLSIGFAGCKSAATKPDPAALVRQANALLHECNKSGAEWSKEYMTAFTPESRAQFPANRESLRAHADKITRLLDENTSQCNKAIEIYDQATPLIKDENQRKGTALITSSLRKSLETNEVMKSQMQLIADESITTAKVFNEKFLEIFKQVNRIEREQRTQFEEGRRLLGM